MRESQRVRRASGEATEVSGGRELWAVMAERRGDGFSGVEVEIRLMVVGVAVGSACFRFRVDLLGPSAL